MNGQTRNQLASLLKAKFEVAAHELRLSCTATCGLRGSLQAHAFTNERELVLGYLSCLPHQDPTEEAIDAVITIQLHGFSASVISDIAWSDGRIIEEGKATTVEGTDTAELLGKLEVVIQVAIEQLVRSMEALLCDKSIGLTTSKSEAT